MNNILEVKGLVTQVAGYTIIDDLDFSVREGELRVLLGPNGAGKTTLIDMITGRFKPKSGKIYFDGLDITGMPPDRIFGFGISRKFQVPNIYETLSVYDNIMVSLEGHRKVFKSLFRKVTPEDSDRIWEILELVGLEDKAGDPADTLSHGERQWIELGMIVGGNPRFMLLDEPTTGMTTEGKHKTAKLIQEIAKTHTVLLVEHDMDVVRQIAEIVTVIHQGQLLAEGPLAEIVSNETVQEIYLGKGAANGD